MPRVLLEHGRRACVAAPSAICATGTGFELRDVFRFSSTMDMSSRGTQIPRPWRPSRGHPRRLDTVTGNAGPARAAAAAAQGVSCVQVLRGE